MPKNPEEVAKPSIGKVILALGRLNCVRDILRKVWKIPKCEDNFFFLQYNCLKCMQYHQIRGFSGAIFRFGPPTNQGENFPHFLLIFF